MLGIGGPLDMGGNTEIQIPENKSNYIFFDCDFECGNVD